MNQFIPFVMHAPAGTAVYFEVNQGWMISDHLLAEVADALHWLVWAKTTDAQQKPPMNVPKPIPRPKSKSEPVEQSKQKPESRGMTVQEYMERVGMGVDWEEET